MIIFVYLGLLKIPSEQDDLLDVNLSYQQGQNRSLGSGTDSSVM